MTGSSACPGSPGLAAAVFAALFTVIQIPRQTPETTGVTYVVLRWFHSITWLLLAVSFLVRGRGPGLASLVDAIGLMGLVAYVAFRLTMSRTGSRQSPARGQPS